MGSGKMIDLRMAKNGKEAKQGPKKLTKSKGKRGVTPPPKNTNCIGHKKDKVGENDYKIFWASRLKKGGNMRKKRDHARKDYGWREKN